MPVARNNTEITVDEEPSGKIVVLRNSLLDHSWVATWWLLIQQNKIQARKTFKKNNTAIDFRKNHPILAYSYFNAYTLTQ